MIKLEMHGKKWEIFERTIYLFAQNGYENVSMREIAKESGLRASSLYNYFPSKESLLELMYEFYSANITKQKPDLATLLARAPDCQPHELLQSCMQTFSAELQPLMDSIYAIVVARSNRDPRAYDVIRNITFAHSNKIVGAVLRRLVELGRIAPLDIDTFTLLYASFCFTAAFRNSTDPVGADAWLAGQDMLFSLVKERPPA